jgi:hypothetical protein
MLLLSWSVLAFGGNYPWAYVPVLVAAPMIGLWGIRLAWARGAAALPSRALAAVLAAVSAAVATQLIPLPRGVLSAVSPAAVAFLNQLDVLFAQGFTGHALSVNTRATAVGLAFVVALGLLFLGVLSLLRVIGARRVATGVAVLAILVAIIGITQYSIGDYRIYGFWTPVYGREPFGPFVNRNHFAGWMVMAFALSLGLVAGRAESAMREMDEGWRNKVLWWLSPEGNRTVLLFGGVVVMGASIVLTRSRSGVIALALALGLFAMAALRGRGFVRRFAVLAVVTALAAGIVVWGNADAVGQRFFKTEWLSGRWAAWSDAARVARDFWLTGSGLNTFSDAMIVYQRRPGAHLMQAHSDWLQLMSEGGLLVCVPALVGLGLFAWELQRRFRERADDPMTWWLRVTACAALAAIALQESAEFSLQMPGNAVLFTVIAAIAIHQGPSVRPLNARL